MKTAIKAGKIVLAALSLTLFSASSFAGNPVIPVPTCPIGQVAKMELGVYQCKDRDRTSNVNPNDPVRVGRDDSKVANDSSTQGPGGDKPHCAKGKLPKLENGVWMCKDPALTSKPDGKQGLLLPAVQGAREQANR